MRGVLLALFLLAVPASGQIVVLGDSLAHGAGDETGRGIAGVLGAVNLGVNGARTADMLRHLERDDVRAAVRRARWIVVSIGGNDLFGSSLERIRSILAPRLTTELVVARVARVIAKIRGENPSAKIVLLGLFNPYRETKIGPWLDEQVARWDGRIITRFAANRAVNVVRIADLIDERRAISPIDHYHPSAAGYRAIAERIRAAYTFSSP
ncbi:MAG TPA: GDSL-type esterase/lipase family protein [Thermoanaerobaculia bacterium]|nr:GDSL-type esterase/lipase family protein [Thermoanaerobaculia bacterium]